MIPLTKFTTTQLAKFNNISRKSATALIAYLKEAGFVEAVGMHPRPEGQKGRGETIYACNSDTVTTHLGSLNLGSLNLSSLKSE